MRPTKEQPAKTFQLTAVRAINWKKLPASAREAMLLMGTVPVNDVFMPLWRNTNKLNLLYGSFGSGKSVFIVDELIRCSLENSYFRCYYGRKVLDTVRGTVFKTITDRIKELRLERFFHFSDAPNGSMLIRCKINGNEFIPFGANDSASLKSIKDPTHFFCEEMDQFTFTDFGNIFSRLRTEKALTQFYGAFNTERVYQSHWIRKVLLDGEYSHLVTATKANYVHNCFIDHADYESKLRLIAGGDALRFNAIAHGEWGSVRTGYEFWKQFSETKHVRPVQVTKGAMHISIDENVNPYVTNTIWQIDSVGKYIRQVHEIMGVSPDNNAPKSARKVADWLHSINHQDVVFLYGDPSGKRKSTVDANSRSFYDKYIEVLRNNGFTVISRVSKAYPEVAISAAFINEIYESNLNGWKIEISEKCFTSINDYILVKEEADGTMMKPKEKDEQSKITYEPEGHISDAKRYFITKALEPEFKLYKARRRRTGSVAA